MHVVGFAVRPGLFVAFPGVVVDAGVFFHGLGHGHAGPRAFHVDLLAQIGDLQRAADFLGDVDVQLLHQIHDLVIVGIGLIKLDGGKFGIVTGVHALVAEDTAHLVHLVKAAHNEPLQVQLGLNTQVHGDVQRVVVGDEGAGVGADLDGLQNGSVHL